MGAVYRVKRADATPAPPVTPPVTPPIVTRKVGPLELHVDRPKGSQKTWNLPDGPLTRTYPVDYGYLPGHHGEDGEPLDFFIGSDPERGWHGSFHKRLRVYDGQKPVGFKPDETKYFAGLTPEEHAEVLKMFDGPTSGLITGHRFFSSLPGLQGALARHRVKTAGSRLRDAMRFVESEHWNGMRALRMLHGDREVGAVVFKRPGVIQGVSLQPEYRNMGLGRKLYGEAMRRSPIDEITGRPTLFSDAVVSPEAQRAWASMSKRKGYKIEPSANAVFRSGNDGVPQWDWDWEKKMNNPRLNTSFGLFSGSLPAAAAKTAAHKTKIFEGERFKIDRPKGYVKKWDSGKEFTYPCDYGYFPKLKGEDGEGLDAFVGDDPNGHYESFLKLKPNDDGKMVPDETKFLLGVSTEDRKKIYGLYGKEVSKKVVYSSMAEAVAAAEAIPGKKRFMNKAEKAAMFSAYVGSKFGGLRPEVILNAVQDGELRLPLDEREKNRLVGAVEAVRALQGKTANRANPYGRVAPQELLRDEDSEFDASPDFFLKRAGTYTVKSAARRGIKELRKAVDRGFPAFEGGTLGDFVHYDTIIEHLKKQFGEEGIRNIMAGRDVAEVGKALGHGSEGAAYPALGRDGFGVLKIHDPTAPLYSPAVIQGKRQFIGHNNPHLAKIHYELKPRTAGGRPVNSFMHEFVSGDDLSLFSPADRVGAANLEKAMRSPAVARGGHTPIDVGMHNIKRQWDGTYKAVDFVAAPVSQLIPNGPREGALAEAFRQGMNAPFIKGINSVKPADEQPFPAMIKAKRMKQDYGKELLRDTFGGVRQVRKDRSAQAVLNGINTNPQPLRLRLLAERKVKLLQDARLRQARQAPPVVAGVAQVAQAAAHKAPQVAQAAARKAPQGVSQATRLFSGIRAPHVAGGLAGLGAAGLLGYGAYQGYKRQQEAANR